MFRRDARTMEAMAARMGLGSTSINSSASLPAPVSQPSSRYMPMSGGSFSLTNMEQRMAQYMATGGMMTPASVAMWPPQTNHSSISSTSSGSSRSSSSGGSIHRLNDNNSAILQEQAMFMSKSKPSSAQSSTRSNFDSYHKTYSQSSREQVHSIYPSPRDRVDPNQMNYVSKISPTARMMPSVVHSNHNAALGAPSSALGGGAYGSSTLRAAPAPEAAHKGAPSVRHVNQYPKEIERSYRSVSTGHNHQEPAPLQTAYNSLSRDRLASERSIHRYQTRPGYHEPSLAEKEKHLSARQTFHTQGPHEGMHNSSLERDLPVRIVTSPPPSTDPSRNDIDAPLDLSKPAKRKCEDAPLDLSVKRSRPTEEDDVILLGVEQGAMSQVPSSKYGHHQRGFLSSNNYRKMMKYPGLSSSSSVSHHPSLSPKVHGGSIGRGIPVPRYSSHSAVSHSSPYSSSLYNHSSGATTLNQSENRIYVKERMHQLSSSSNGSSTYKSSPVSQREFAKRRDLHLSGGRGSIIPSSASMHKTIGQQSTDFNHSPSYHRDIPPATSSIKTSAIFHPPLHSSDRPTVGSFNMRNAVKDYRNLSPQVVNDLYRSASPRTRAILQRELDLQENYRHGSRMKSQHQESREIIDITDASTDAERQPGVIQANPLLNITETSAERNSSGEAKSDVIDEKDTIVRPIFEGGEIRGFKHVPIANVNPMVHGSGGDIKEAFLQRMKLTGSLQAEEIQADTCVPSQQNRGKTASSNTVETVVKTDDVKPFSSTVGSVIKQEPQMFHQADASTETDIKLDIKSEPVASKESSGISSLSLHLSTPKGRFKLNNSSPVTEMESAVDSPSTLDLPKVKMKKKVKAKCKRSLKKTVREHGDDTGGSQSEDGEKQIHSFKGKRKKKNGSSQRSAIHKKLKRAQQNKTHKWHLRTKGKGFQPGYNRDAAYEAELQKDQQRKLFLSAKRRQSKSQQEGSNDSDSTQHYEATTEDEILKNEHRFFHRPDKSDVKYPFKGRVKHFKKRRGRAKKTAKFTIKRRTKAVLKRKRNLALCHGSVDETNIFHHDAFESDTDEYYHDPDVAQSDAPIRNVPPEVKALVICREIGETKLHKAARLGYEEVALWILEAGFVEINLRDHAGYTALHEAAANGYINIAQALLYHKADVNSASHDGIRPLHDAVVNSHIEMVRLLLSNGADPNIATYAGNTPLKLAKTDDMRSLLSGFLVDLNGPSSEETPWQLHPPFVMDVERHMIGDVTTQVPLDDTSNIEPDLNWFDEEPIPTYQLIVDEEIGPRNYYLLKDIATKLKKAPSELKSMVGNLTVKCSELRKMISCSIFDSLSNILDSESEDVIDIVPCSKCVDDMLEDINVDLVKRETVVEESKNCDSKASVEEVHSELCVESYNSSRDQDIDSDGDGNLEITISGIPMMDNSKDSQELSEENRQTVPFTEYKDDHDETSIPNEDIKPDSKDSCVPSPTLVVDLANHTTTTVDKNVSPKSKTMVKPAPRPGFHNLPVTCLPNRVPSRIAVQKPQSRLSPGPHSRLSPGPNRAEHSPSTLYDAQAENSPVPCRQVLAPLPSGASCDSPKSKTFVGRNRLDDTTMEPLNVSSPASIQRTSHPVPNSADIQDNLDRTKDSPDYNSNSTSSDAQMSSGSTLKGTGHSRVPSPRGPTQKLTEYSSAFLQFVQQRQHEEEQEQMLRSNFRLALQQKVNSRGGLNSQSSDKS